MSTTLKQPTSLFEAVQFFADEDRAFDTMIARRWPAGVRCPLCQSENVRFMAAKKFWNCNGCRKQFSVKTGTIFEASPISLGKWLTGMWLVVNAKNGISSCEIARSLGITQKSAWFMAHRIRLALANGTIEKLGGHVEADETYVGGKAANMHKHKKDEILTRIGGAGKTIVMGFLERGGSAKTLVVTRTNTPTIQGHVKANVDRGSFLYTDALASYRGMTDLYKHYVIDHAKAFVDGNAHTNGLENYWSLLKRCIKGTYIAIAPFHLNRYLAEQEFRYNERRVKDGDRFVTAASQVTGKRLTYRQLIGKELAAGL